MFSYRHSFHAGNHADVLKHLTQLCILQKIVAKDKPAIYIDTHSGAGCYDLDSNEAQKTAEFESGVARMSTQASSNPLLADYQQLVMPFWQKKQYPGSPMIAESVLRAQDKLLLVEYHNTEIENLRCNMQSGMAQIHHRDGFEALLAFCPPHPKRGLVLIDPPYEHISEYQRLYDCLHNATKKWPVGVFAVWYPLLSARAGKKSGKSEQMLRQLSQLPVKNVLDIRLKVQDNNDDAGMYGSGMVILNAPWQVDEIMQQALDELVLQLTETTPVTGEVTWLKRGD